MRAQTLMEAKWILAVLVVVAVLCAVASYFWVSILCAILILATLAFFRDPNRTPPADDPYAVLAAADGVVADVAEVEESQVLFARMQRVGIFLSVFDVHVNRAPIEGQISFRERREGSFLDARNPEAANKNEAMTWAFVSPWATIVVRQLTGAIARRIVAWSDIGDEMKRGERFGMIRFGSRTEVYLPLNAKVLVKVGDRVTGGETVIARLV